jgi:iron complex outermembrane recepter protein
MCRSDFGGLGETTMTRRRTPTVRLDHLALTIAGLMALPAPGMAQERRAALEEVIVTSERRAASLQEVPVSVVAFSPNELAAMTIETLQDLQAVTPNLNVSPGRGAPNALGFNIRGIGGGGVALYIDDVFFPTGRSILRTVDIESLEVLRGPQGTLFGRNSTGGAVRVTTRKPSDTFAADVEVRAGEFDWFDVEGSLNVPLSDQVFLKFKAARLQRDGYVQRFGVTDGDQGDLGNVDDKIGSLALRWLPKDDVTVDFAARYEERDSNPMTRVVDAMAVDVGPLGFHARELNRQLINTGQPPLVNNDARVLRDDFTQSGLCFVEDNDPLTFDEACYTTYESKNTQLTARVGWDLSSEHTLSFMIGYADVETRNVNDWIGFGAETRYSDTESDTRVAEIVLNSTLLGGRLDLVSGFNYYDDNNGELEHIIRNHDPDEMAATRDIRGDLSSFTSMGVFSQGTYHLGNDRTSITLGLRYTSEEQDVLMREWESGTFNIRGWNDCSTASSATSVVVRDPSCVVIVPASEDWGQVDWRLALDHRINDQMMLYVSASKAFRSGTFNHVIQPHINPANQRLAATDPEEVVNKEIGIRSDWFDDRLRLNLTYFDMDFSNRQGPILFTTPDGSGLEVLIVDQEDVYSQGWEMDASFAATDNLTFTLSAGRADPQLAEINPPTTVYIVDTPKYSGNLGMRYFAAMNAGAEMTLSMNYSWQDEYRDFSWCCSDGENMTPSYGTLNGRLEFYLPNRNLTLALAGRNLTDEVYAVNQAKHVSRFMGPPGPPGTTYGTENWLLLSDRGMPRMLYASVKLEF